MYDLLIIGAGPAGLAAATHAHSNGLSYLLLERADHIADTVFAYQARKFVMTEPSMIPTRSDLPFQAGSRESILDSWQRHVADKKLNVHLNAEVKTLVKEGDRFILGTAPGERYEARNVILAMGTQGNPRKLGVPGEELDNVRNRLVDAAEFQDRDILVVGAGDSALEVAIALAKENRVGLVVRGSEITRANQILMKEVLSLQASGQMTIYYNATVKHVHQGYADLTVRGDVVRVPAEFIFLKLGADPPRKFFESIGVRYSGSSKDARQILSPVYESTLPGLFIIGAASGRDLIKLGAAACCHGRAGVARDVSVGDGAPVHRRRDHHPPERLHQSLSGHRLRPRRTVEAP